MAESGIVQPHCSSGINHSTKQTKAARQKSKRSTSSRKATMNSDPLTLTDQDASIEISYLKSKLDQLRCHFTWKPEQIDLSGPHQETINDVEKRLSTCDPSLNNPLLNICRFSLLAYIHTLHRNYGSSSHILGLCSTVEMNDPAAEKYEDGCRYVLRSDKAHLFFLLKQYELSAALLVNLKSYSQLAPKQKAVVLAIEGYCHMEFGTIGLPMLVKQFEEAANLDKTNPAWQYLLDTVFCQSPRDDARTRQKPAICETEHLRNATENDQLPENITISQNDYQKPHCSVTTAMSQHASAKLKTVRPINAGKKSKRSTACKSLKATTSSCIPTQPDQTAPNLTLQVEDASRQRHGLKSKLDELLCHFTWKPDQTDLNCPYQETVNEVEKRVSHCEPSVKNPLLNICRLSVLAYVYTLNQNYKRSSHILGRCSTDEIKDPALEDYQDGLLYVLRSDEAHVSFLLKKYNVADALLKSLKSYSDLEPKQKAVVLAIAGYCHMEFGSMGFPRSVMLFEQAVQLDKTNPVWHYLLGKVLGQIRRIDARTHQIPSISEMEHLKNAARNGRHPDYSVLLAQTIMEKSDAMSKVHGKNRHLQEIKQLNGWAKNLFVEALKENPNCAMTNIRCANGFRKLPHPFKDISLAEKCFTRARWLKPNSNMILHSVGNFYERSKQDPNSAKECYQKCVGKAVGNYGAEMDLLRNKRKTIRGFDPVPDFHRILERYQYSARKVETYIQLGSYYHLDCDDLENALEFYSKAVEVNPRSPALSVSFPVFHPGKMINVYSSIKIILNQLMEDTNDPEKQRSYSVDLMTFEMLRAGKQ